MSAASRILLLDLGNSRIKWALVEPGSTAEAGSARWLAEGAAEYAETGPMLRAWEEMPCPHRVFGANVAGGEAAAALVRYWQARQIPLAWARTAAQSCGVRNGYEQPAQLGIDRWAALVGAWQQQKAPCLVICAGTALTLDSLDREGVFQGGMILPGRRLMLDSLAAGAHALDIPAGQACLSPRNTADAIASGISAALAAPVRESFARLAAVFERPACLLTGGDAGWLSSQLQIRCTIAPRLIFEGLLAIVLEDTPA